MIGPLPLLRSLDPWHQRLGYLGVVVLHAIRDIDTPDALNARIATTLFEKIYPDTPRHGELWARIPEDRRATLIKSAGKRKPEDDHAAILRPLQKAGEWFTLCELWINDERVTSNLGVLKESKAHRIVDLANLTGLLLPTHELSESGVLLRTFIERSGADRDNPLVPLPAWPVRLVYLRIMLEADSLWPDILRTMAAETAAGRPLRSYTAADALGLLRLSLEQLLATVSASADVDDINALRPIREYLESVSGSQSTEENYLRPRMEMLIDLGLVRRIGDDRAGHFVWSLTDEGRRMALLLAPLATAPADTGRFLDSRFFNSCAEAYALPVTGRVSSDAEIMLWFARAFTLVGREFGFTPGRTVAVAACVLALEMGRLLEVQEVSDCVYRSADLPFGAHLRFSGGSRMDREFLIRVRPGLAEVCVAALRKASTGLDPRIFGESTN